MLVCHVLPVHGFFDAFALLGEAGMGLSGLSVGARVDAFVESNSDRLDPKHQMYKVSKSIQNGQRNAGMIPVIVLVLLPQ